MDAPAQAALLDGSCLTEQDHASKEPTRASRSEHTKNTIGVPADFRLWLGSNKVEAPMSRLKLLRDQRQLALSKLESLTEDHPLRPRYLERVRELDDQIEALNSIN
jgi:hypothetical protein